MTRGKRDDIPWRQLGWSERAAAAHLLDRFAFGARPGEVDRVVDVGLERWFARQLAAELPETELEARLAPLDLLAMPVREFPEVVRNRAALLQEMRKAGVVPQDFDPRRAAPEELRRLRPGVLRFFRDNGYRSGGEYTRQLLGQKVLRAIYAENQLREVLVDFWFNHFNVSLSDNACRRFVLAYERDAIRPHVTGRFRRLLEATAKHPAMLHYLDNARSTAERDRETTLDVALARRPRHRGALRAERIARQMRVSKARPVGLNENYARELMELHTLGVDGGYSQADVVEVARAFSGWSVYPNATTIERLGRRFERAMSSNVGFHAEGGFLFRADAHDAEEKRVLGSRLARGRGLEDGREVLDLLADHPSTARHLAHKIAVRFVSDTPAPALVERLAERFDRSGGDLAAVVREVARAPEFWGEATRRQKIKSPFEVAASALRGVGASVGEGRAVVQWVERMGQALYRYDAPTGFPDRADFWVNAGALINRMNFGLALAADGVAGVEVDLRRADGGREPESRASALERYAGLLLPERAADLAPLLPMIEEPQLADRVRREADAAAPEARVEESLPWEAPAPEAADGGLEPGALAQVVGVLLGSPEFQRR